MQPVLPVRRSLHAPSARRLLRTYCVYLRMECSDYCVVRLELGRAGRVTTVGATRVDHQDCDRILGRAASSNIDSLQAFVQRVQQLVQEGWVPAGGPVCVDSGAAREQALVKRS